MHVLQGFQVSLSVRSRQRGGLELLLAGVGGGHRNDRAEITWDGSDTKSSLSYAVGS